jgi:23S rRNA (pseudouridine1915-N3)-methyltransferase
MRITFLMVGKSEFPFVKEGMSLYEKRIEHYVNFEHIEICNIKGTSSLPVELLKEKEGTAILKHIKEGDKVILLDERGKKYSSLEWASQIEKEMNIGSKNIIFIVGGAFGFSKEVYERADSLLSLSTMTFSHQIIRLFFTEQLYRAFTIIKREPYHNE